MDMDIGHRIGLQLAKGADFADCTFLVNGHNIEAHRVILAAASPVFETMLTPPWGKQGQVIEVDDITYEDFMDVLNFCYSDYITLRSIEHAGDLLYAFKKYMIFQASDKCRSYLRANVRIDTAHIIYKICVKLNEEDLRKVAFIHVCQYPAVILNEYLNEIDSPLFKEIVNSNHLNLCDVHLIEYAWKWAIINIKKRGMSLKKRHNVRKILASEGILTAIRFLVLTPEEFQYCEQYIRAMLYYREIVYVMDHMGIDNPEASPNNATQYVSSSKVPRIMIAFNLVSIQRMIIYPMRFLPIIYNTVLTVGIRADCTILLRGFLIPSRTTSSLLPQVDFNDHTYHERILFTIQQQSDQNVTPYMGCINNRVPYDTLQTVFLDRPMLIKRNEWYDFVFSWQRLEYDVFYKADSCVIQTRAGVTIEYRDQFEEHPCRRNFGHSFLKGVKYNI